MATNGFCRVDINKLKELADSLKTKPSIEIGWFQTKSARKSGELTNAYLASIHEYGYPKHGLPPRSMLRIPIHDHIKEIMDVAKGKGEELVKKSGAMALWKLLGKKAETIVLQAFDTGGFGKWAPLKYSTLLAKLNKGKTGRPLARRKGILAKIYTGEVGMGILIYSGQLRRSVSSRVRMKF